MTKSKLMIAIVVSVILVGGAYFFLRPPTVPFTRIPNQSGNNAIDFDTITEESALNSGPKIIVSAPQAIQDIQLFLTPESFETLQATIEPHSIVIGAFQGVVYNYPNGILIKSITIKEDILTVYVEVVGTEGVVVPAGPYAPADVVMIDSRLLRSELDTFTVLMIDQANKQMAETTYHRP